MAKKTAFSGICAAMSVVCMLLNLILPTTTVFLVCFSTVFIPLVLEKCGALYAVCALIAAAALVFVFLPDKFLCASFGLLGIYAVIKSYIERIGILWAEWIIKLAVYIIFAAAVYFVFFANTANAFWIIGAGALIFAVYDVALSVAITYLAKKIKNI